MKHFRTAKYTNELLKEVAVIKPTHTTMSIKVDVNQRYQEIIGFGGAFTEATVYNLSRVNKTLRQQILRDYFDPKDGLGYTLGRVSIHGCDFSLGSYLYIDDYDDDLSTFTINRDLPIIQTIQDAEKIAGKPIQILASPWTPPFWMKDNQSPVQGGKLLKKYYPHWARYFLKFIEAYEAKGIHLFGVSVQNEPAAVQRWDSCIYSAEEERDFVRDHLGPILEEAGHSNKRILIWDHNRDILVERVTPILNDLEAAKYIWGVAYHWYVSEDFENLSKVKTLFPETNLLFTEGCQEGGPHFNVWETGERYARNMIGDFNHHSRGYIDWNLVLDETGGPNHVNNLCDAPIMLHIFPETYTKQSSYYYIGHFSKYVLPGSIRLMTESDGVLKAVSFIRPDQHIVLIVMNDTESDVSTSINSNESIFDVVILKRSISTFIL